MFKIYLSFELKFWECSNKKGFQRGWLRKYGKDGIINKNLSLRLWYINIDDFNIIMSIG